MGDNDLTRVFFYGLFMDEGLLEAKGMNPQEARIGSVTGFKLRIGERAALAPATGARAYGVVMTLGQEVLDALYSDESVVDYKPEQVTVELIEGARVPALCYNLPSEQVRGTNEAYAQSLLALATRLGLPDSYLQQIRTASGANRPEDS